MAVEDELRLDFQGEDSSLSSTAAKVVNQINTLDSAINKLINSFNLMSQSSSSAESGLSSFVKSSNGLEEIGAKVEKITENFAAMNPAIENMTNSLNTFNNASGSVDDLNTKIQEENAKLQKNNQVLEESKKKTDNLKNSNKSLAQSFNVMAGVLAPVYGILKKWTLGAADATRAQVRFGAVFNDTNGELAEAKKWVDNYSNALYLDSVEVENAISKFRVLTNSMGMNNEKSKEMSFNMTQLAYDLKAVSGNDISQTVNQLTSALSGQTKALSEYGIAIDNNTMQQYLNARGIDRKVASLTAAQRAEVRYMQIMESSAGIQGYYAKTLMSPSNALNIIKTQFSLLAREIGNVFIPILMALVPVVITITKALRSLAQALASFFGINIDFSDYSKGLSLMSDGVGDIGDTADKTSKKVKNMLRDFDDLHVVDFGDDSKDAAGSGGGVGGGIGGGDSLFDAQEYADWSQYIDDISSKFKEWLPLIVAIGAAFAAWKITQIIDGIKTFLKALDANPLVMFLLGITLIASGVALFKSGIDDIVNGTFDLSSAFKLAAGAALIFAGSLAVVRALSNANLFGLGGKSMLELAKIAGGLTFIIGGLVGLFVSLNNIITGTGDEFTNLGIALASVAAIAVGVFIIFGGVPALIALIVGLIAVAVAEIVRHWDAIKAKALELWEAISSTFEEIWGKISDVFNKIKEKAIEIWDAITNVFIQIGTWVNDNVIQPVLSVVVPLFTKIGEIIHTIWQIITTVFGALFKWVYDKVIKPIIDAIMKFKDKAVEIFTGLWKAITNVFTKVKDSITKVLSAIRDWMKQHVIDPIAKWFSAAFESIADFAKSIISGAINGALSVVEGIINFFIRGLNAVVDIVNKIPGASISRVTELVLPRFAEGGFPDKGQLFIANEREPELIGSMGNRSVVANNAQITEGIAQASYGAFKQALSEMGDNFGGDTLVYVGDTQLTDVITKKKRIQDKRFGR